MKKKIMVITIGLVLIFGIIIAITTRQKNIYTEIGGVKYAIIVDKESANTFPSGNYKANIDCTNAKGYWDAVQQKVIIREITGQVICYIEFTSITNNDYLNSYVISLENDANQGNGMVVHEFVSNDDTNLITVPMTQASTNTMTVTNNEYTGTQTTSKTSSYQKFYPQSDGYYRLCYRIPSSSSTKSSNAYKNYLVFYTLNSTYSTISTISSNNNNGTTISGCTEYGYLTTSDYIYIQNYYYDNNVTLYFQKADNQSLSTAGYRYEGKNPNNYVWFNNELWRIIGVFGPESHGQTGKQLVKIIRNNPIGGLAWDNKETNGVNNWNTSSLKSLLNNAYYNHTIDSTNCYGYSVGSNKVPATCDYTKKGIQSNYQGMIENVTWYLGGGDGTVIDAYQYERKGIVYSGNPTTGEGKIGLMYKSDYLYGVKASECTRSTSTSYYNNANCAGRNWLYNGTYEWTITPGSSSAYGTGIVHEDGSFMSYIPAIGNGVRPVLYLSSSVYKISGTGTLVDPYIIGMASN